MKKIKDRMQLAMIKAQMGIRTFIHNEKGDTNFISIAIILAIVLAIAAVFIIFGRDVMAKMQEAIADLGL